MPRDYHRYTDEEVIKMATEYLKDNEVRLIKTAKKLNMPLTTLWWELTHRLPKLDGGLYNLVAYKLKHMNME